MPNPDFYGAAAEYNELQKESDETAKNAALFEIAKKMHAAALEHLDKQIAILRDIEKELIDSLVRYKEWISNKISDYETLKKTASSLTPPDKAADFDSKKFSEDTINLFSDIQKKDKEVVENLSVRNDYSSRSLNGLSKLLSSPKNNSSIPKNKTEKINKHIEKFKTRTSSFIAKNAGFIVGGIMLAAGIAMCLTGFGAIPGAALASLGLGFGGIAASMFGAIFAGGNVVANKTIAGSDTTNSAFFINPRKSEAKKKQDDMPQKETPHTK